MGYPQTTLNIIKAFLDKTGCQVDYDLDEAVWIRAGEIYAIYAARRRASKDEPRRLITDFIIGAHASLKADQLMTLDAVRYRKNFPSLTLITHAP
jgi:predicted nucleic acid-binding protein